MTTLDPSGDATALQASLERVGSAGAVETPAGRTVARSTAAWPAALAHVLLHAVAFTALTWWSWRCWPDPLTDFGRELYVPWQLAQGKVLYRDIASLFGPFSPYFNAALFRAFGASLDVLIFSNLAILATTLAGIHDLVRTAAGWRVATTVTLWVMAIFAFGQYVTVGNYNFVSPYSHEATHGFALGVWTLVFAHRALSRGHLASFVLGGVCFGLVLLTKPEIAVAVMFALAVGLIARTAVSGDSRGALGRGCGAFALAALVAPLAFVAYFSAHMALPAALPAAAGAWRPAWTPGIATGSFYRLVAGLDEPALNALRMIGIFTVIAAVLVSAAVVSHRIAEGPGGGPIRRYGWLGALAVLLAVVPWAPAFPRALPLTTLSALAATAVLVARHRADRERAIRLIAPLMWSAFALALLAKMLLNARIFHYGFYLALPATATLIASLAWLVPELIARRFPAGTAAVFRRLAMAFVAAALVPYLVLANMVYERHRTVVGQGRDRFYALDDGQLWQGTAAAEAVQAIRELTAPDDTVAVLPEGVMLNYLSRRKSPLRVVNVMPPELAAFGEQQVLADLASRRPRLVLLVQRNVEEYGYPPFGRDARYGQQTMAWIRRHYEPVRTIPRDPGPAGPRITVLARRP